MVFVLKRYLAFDNSQNLAFVHYQQVFTVNLDSVAAGIRTKDHFVANLDSQLAHFAIVQYTAGTNGNDLTLVGLFSSGTGQHNTTGSFGFFFTTADYYAVMQRTKLHCRSLLTDDLG